jgi:hypothetical protein
LLLKDCVHHRTFLLKNFLLFIGIQSDTLFAFFRILLVQQNVELEFILVRSNGYIIVRLSESLPTLRLQLWQDCHVYSFNQNRKSQLKKASCIII